MSLESNCSNTTAINYNPYADENASEGCVFSEEPFVEEGILRCVEGATTEQIQSCIFAVNYLAENNYFEGSGDVNIGLGDCSSAVSEEQWFWISLMYMEAPTTNTMHVYDVESMVDDTIDSYLEYFIENPNEEYSINGGYATMRDILVGEYIGIYSDCVLGCMDLDALNYSSAANGDNGSCLYAEDVSGCMSESSTNFNPYATVSDGSCYTLEMGWKGASNDFDCPIINALGEVGEAYYDFNRYVSVQPLSLDSASLHLTDIHNSAPVFIGNDGDSKATQNSVYKIGGFKDQIEASGWDISISDPTEQSYVFRIAESIFVDIDLFVEILMENIPDEHKSQVVIKDNDGNSIWDSFNLYEINEFTSDRIALGNWEFLGCEGGDIIIPKYNLYSVVVSDINVELGSIDFSEALSVANISSDVLGCTDSEAIGYNPLANVDDGSCVAVVYGCSDSEAVNYNPDANFGNGNNAVDCIYDENIEIVEGCTTPNAVNYNQNANANDGSCVYEEIDLDILGCTDNSANNYDVDANVDNDSCVYDAIDISGCIFDIANNYNPDATIDDGSCTFDVVADVIEGCTDIDATNYDSEANLSIDSCVYDDVVVNILGCTDSKATNYNSDANVDNGLCDYATNQKETPTYKTPLIIGGAVLLFVVGSYFLFSGKNKSKK